ncbi:hypothetical protein HKD37_09G025074 [Glycine soja]
MSQHVAIQPHIVSALIQMLDDHNVHAKSFRMARDRLTDSQLDNVKLRLIAGREKDGRTNNLPNVFEVAALIVGDFDADSRRDIIVETQNRELQRIHELHSSYLGLQLESKSNEAQTLLHSRKLFQQFIVEAYTMIKSKRLSYIRNNQKKLRVDRYCSLQTSLDAGSSKGSSKGKRVILPSTFVGSPRYMDQLYFDGMTICSHVDFPNLFITLTCNPNWPEIRRILAPLNLKAADRPDLISRICTQLNLKKEDFLTCIYCYFCTQTINIHSDEIDQIISAEIPSHENDPKLYTLVQNHMVHGPCGILQSKSPCMKEGMCSRFYPKMFQPQTVLDSNDYPIYRRRNDGRTISKNGVIIDNRYIVPYNAKLLRKYQTHINIEWCNQNTSIKYLFKYINKGYDRVTAVVVYDANGALENPITQNDEIKKYVDCGYISPCEATWRIFGFPIHARKLAVERLHFHLPGQHNVLYEEGDDIDDILSKPSISDSKFLAWMNSNKCFSEDRNITYSQFVSKFVYNQKARSWNLIKKGNTIGRLIWVPATIGELFYLRMMLTTCKGPTSFEDIRTVENVLYPTYREACFAMGFLQDDREFVEAIKEAKDWGTTNYLRKLFVPLLNLKNFGIRHEIELDIDDEQLKNLTLLEIEKLLHVNQKSLKDYPTMPYPEGANHAWCLENNLILSELNYNNDEARSEFENLFSSMTDEQKQIYHKIMQAVNNNEGGMFLLHGYGGTGKTYIWRTLASSLRAKNQIVIMVASSGKASLLFPGGRTTHSKFKIPDEAPMAHKFFFQALDQSLTDIIKEKKNPNQIFGGKVIVFGGDFRQILPVIPRGSCSDIINATINSSYLWPSCEVLTLTKNMRLQGNAQSIDDQETTKFAKWILDIGDEVIGNQNDGYATVEILDYLLITEYNDPIDAIVKSTFPDLYQHHNNPQFFKSRAILASTNETVEELKIDSPVILLRNIDQTQGLCNGTRLVVTRLAKHVIAAEIISGKNLGHNVYIPRMSMSPSQSP